MNIHEFACIIGSRQNSHSPPSDEGGHGSRGSTGSRGSAGSRGIMVAEVSCGSRGIMGALVAEVSW